jgi:hypothetical protein
VDHLARKWELTEDEVLAALKECGFIIPEDEDAKPACVEYEGDLYWVNVNRRGERWINTKEKPRAMFRIAKAARAPDDAGEETRDDRRESPETAPEESRPPARSEMRHRDARPGPAPAQPLAAGPELLEKIRPLMRRSRRGPGGSGSLSFLSRALKCSEAELAGGFAALGLTEAEAPDAKPAFIEIGERLWWLNRDQRGGLWINERDKRDDAGQEEKSEGGEFAAEKPPEHAAPPAPGAETSGASPLAALRLLLKKTRTGSFSGEIGHLAAALGKSPEELLAALTGEGLQIPEKARAKPVFVEHAGEIFWLNRNPKDELWLNAKESKFSESGSRRGTGKKPTTAEVVPSE